jgi:hypothetical protein
MRYGIHVRGVELVGRRVCVARGLALEHDRLVRIRRPVGHTRSGAKTPLGHKGLGRTTDTSAETSTWTMRGKAGTLDAGGSEIAEKLLPFGRRRLIEQTQFLPQLICREPDLHG